MLGRPLLQEADITRATEWKSPYHKDEKGPMGLSLSYSNGGSWSLTIVPKVSNTR